MKYALALLCLVLGADVALAQAPPADAPPARLSPMARFKKWRLGISDLCARQAVQYEAVPDEERPLWVYAWAFEGTMLFEGDCSFGLEGRVFSSYGDDELLNACPGGIRDLDFNGDGRRDLLVWSQDCAAGPTEGDTVDLCLDDPGGPSCENIVAGAREVTIVRRSGRVIVQAEFCGDFQRCLSGDEEERDLRWKEIFWDGQRVVTVDYTARPPAAVTVP